MLDYRVLASGAPSVHGDANVDVHIQFATGSVVFLSTDERDFAHYELELVGCNGRLRYESAGHRVFWQGIQQSPLFPDSQAIAQDCDVIDSRMNAFQDNVASEIEALLAGQPSHLVLGHQDVRSLGSFSRILSEI